MAAASTRSPRRWRAPAARRSSSRICPRRGACAPSRREAVIYVLNGFSRRGRPGFVETYARPVINSLVELAEWDHFVSTSGLAGGAALHVDTGMNRLGLTIEEAAAIAAHIQLGEPPHHAADEPPRLRRPARASAERSADPAVPRNPLAVSRHLRARSPTPPASSSTRRPIATWCAPASRSTAAIRRRASPTRCGR